MSKNIVTLKSRSRVNQISQLLVFYGTLSTNRLYHAIEVGNVSHGAGGEHKYHAIKQ